MLMFCGLAEQPIISYVIPSFPVLSAQLHRVVIEVEVGKNSESDVITLCAYLP